MDQLQRTETKSDQTYDILESIQAILKQKIQPLVTILSRKGKSDVKN